MIWCLRLTVLSLIISQGADGRRKPEVVSVVGRAGESAVLGCDLLPPAGHPPLHVIEWLRFGFLLPIFIQFGLYSPRIDPDYVGRVRLQTGASLQIEGLRVEDQGWYECRVLFLDQHSPEQDFANGSWVHLTVNSPPQFQETPPLVLEVKELEAVTLRCVARGSPQPYVTWKFRGQDLGKGQGQVQVQNGTLWIRRVERGSAGDYTCQASSSEGSITHATQLLVLGPPVIVVPPSNSTVNSSQDVSLACRAEAYPANLTYSWFQDGVNVFHISRLQSRVRILVDGSLWLQATQPDDAGHYTCVPSNGFLHPPSASAYLTVLYPAQVTVMPPETPLPTGMRGVIRCPVRANPPLLFVTWTKDGQALQLDKFPGWSLGPEGSLIIALGNENALGEYSCTPYNSLGTAGPSPVTQVLLKVGRGLQGQAQVDSNNSLVLRPLTKEAQGRWECSASNAVARVTTSTNVYVLGTSPHVVTNVSVVPLPKGANVSWEPGFDGGYLQRFSVWYTPLAKRPDRAHHDWVSLAVPIGATHLLVPGLQAHAQYQFSVLAQNKLGSGPFSEIVLSIPEGLPTTPAAPGLPPTEIPPPLSPPRGLVAVRTPRGGPDGRFVMGPTVAPSQEKLCLERSEPRTSAKRLAQSFDCSSSSPSGVPQPLCITDISPVGQPLAAVPSPLPGPGPLLQYLSLPFFREMNVDGDWPPLEEPTPAPPPDFMDSQPCPTSSFLPPPDSPPANLRAVLPGTLMGVGVSSEPPYTALADWTLRERVLPGLLSAAPRGSLTSQSSGRGSASFLRPPSTAPSAGGSYLSPAPGDTSSWASGPERWPRREHVVTVSKRRNTSVDENYEWDSEFPGDMELLETWHPGLASSRTHPELEPELGSLCCTQRPFGASGLSPSASESRHLFSHSPVFPLKVSRLQRRAVS